MNSTNNQKCISTYHVWRGIEPFEGTVSALPFSLPLNKRTRVAKSGSDRCLSQAALKCRPLLLGTQEIYWLNKGMNILFVEIILKIKAYSWSRISIWLIFSLISPLALRNAASLYTRASLSTSLNLKSWAPKESDQQGKSTVVNQYCLQNSPETGFWRKVMQQVLRRM